MMPQDFPVEQEVHRCTPPTRIDGTPLLLIFTCECGQAWSAVRYRGRIGWTKTGGGTMPIAGDGATWGEV